MSRYVLLKSCDLIEEVFDDTSWNSARAPPGRQDVPVAKGDGFLHTLQRPKRASLVCGQGVFASELACRAA